MSFTIGNSILHNPVHQLHPGNKGAIVVPNNAGDGPGTAAPTVLTTTANIYALNVFLNTFLFIMVFVCGSTWTTACLEYVKGAPSTRSMVKFSIGFTLVTCALAIAFGELSRINRNIQVDYQSDLG